MALTNVDIMATMVWPIRPNISDFSKSLSLGKDSFLVELTFPPTYAVTEELKLSGAGWSRFAVCWSQPFAGSLEEMIVWAQEPLNAERLLQRAERVQNLVIDVAKDSNPSNFDFACIRHFGPIEWPLYSISVGGSIVFQRLGSSTAAQFRSTPSEMLPAEAPPNGVAFEKRTWRRAYDLALSGYQTEASLLAAAVIDSAVQEFLAHAMGKKGINVDSAKELLRNTTTKRLVTYLDSILKLAAGHSLREDDNELFRRLKQVNQNRNEAIHNGKEMTRKEALESLLVCREILMYLQQIDGTWGAVPEVPKWAGFYSGG